MRHIFQEGQGPFDLDNAEKLCIAMHEEAKSILEVEHSLIAPLVADAVSAKEQKAIVSKVIGDIGLADLRLHLVHMHEAVVNQQDKGEVEVFRDKVDGVSRMMIPRWKRLLYDPETVFLPDLGKA